jgi:hypothetical protein
LDNEALEVMMMEIDARELAEMKSKRTKEEKLWKMGFTDHSAIVEMIRGVDDLDLAEGSREGVVEGMVYTQSELMDRCAIEEMLRETSFYKEILDSFCFFNEPAFEAVP